MRRAARFARVDARYCSDTHRLKDWRRKKRAARVTAPRLPIQQPHDAEHADVDPGDMPEPEDPEGIASEYQQLLARAREIVHLEGLLIINPRDEDVWPGYGSCGSAQRTRSYSKLESPRRVR